MNEQPDKREPVLGWVLMAAMAVHLLVLRPQSMVSLGCFAVLLVAAILRGRGIYPPGWLSRVLLLFGVSAVILAQVGLSPIRLLGELAATAGTLMLLRPVTPKRGQRVIFCLLVMLVAALLKPYAGIGTAFTVFDVAVLYFLAEQVFRPVEVTISLWESVVRSFRLIVPVGIVVLGVFWLFPNFSLFNQQALTGFAGADFLNPGSISELAQSQRVALTAHFEKDQAVPPPSSIYWRGQVLENNDGFRWSVAYAKVRREQLTLSTPPTDQHNVLRYSQEMTANRGGIVPVLDHAVFIDAKRDGLDVSVLDRGAAVLTSEGTGALSMTVASSSDRLGDEPLPGIAEGYLGVPLPIRDNPEIQDVVARIFAGQSDTPGKLKALAKYFQKGGFHYSLRPGRSQGLAHFLRNEKEGFCEHYAAASGNLLRLSGTPTRLVAGYRGGEWNPWLRTITVRDSDAHAWVEAWDAPTRRWLRFDPTDAVAPEIRAGIQQEMDSSRWPWYRRDWSHARALVTQAASRVEQSWNQLVNSENWEYVPQALFISLVIVALIWLVRRYRSRRPATPQEAAANLLASLEYQAGRLRRERHAGETPLAWLRRLERAASAATEKKALHQLATTYESGMYMPQGADRTLLVSLREYRRQLLRIWKSQPAA